MKYNLPREYISYSSWSLWKKDKDAFRRKYYLNEESFSTAETIYGKHIARLLEDEEEVKKHPVLSLVPRYSVREQKIEVEIAGIRVMGYLDTFEPNTFQFGEFKSGHLSRDGKPPWDIVKVNKHDQLPFYSLLIKEKYGKVDRLTRLHWLETHFKKKTMDFEGMTLEASSRELELTGRIETFKRIIPQWERDNIRESIINAAKEISEDFTNYEKNK